MRRHGIAAAISAAIIIAPDTGTATGAAAAPEESGASDNIQVVEKVAPGVHVMRAPRTMFAGVVGNVTIIEQSDGVVLVDTGSSYGAGKRVADTVNSLTAKPVKAVVITHWHNDHPLGLAAIVERWPDADVIATEATKADMVAGRLGNVPRSPDGAYEEQRRAQLLGYLPDVEKSATDPALSDEERKEWARAKEATKARIPDVAGTYLVLPNKTFTDRYMIDDRKTPVEALFLGRANTPGDAEVWLPKQRILIAGDTVVEPIPYMFNMFPSEHLTLLEKIKAMKINVLVPGHGEVQRDTRYVDKLAALITDVQAQIGPLAKSGLSLEDATARADFSAQTEAFAGSSPWLRYWFERYALTPLIDSVFKEAKGEPLGPPPLDAVN